MDEAVKHILSVVVASAISVAMFAYGLRSRREDGSRRWIFAVGGVIGSVMTIPVGFLSVGQIDHEESLLLVILCVIVPLASLILLRRGVRGRRVGDHPHCRRCGFDLFGRPETSHQCSECGANLDDSRAIVIGVRRPSPAMIFVSLFLLLASLGIGVPIASKLNWNQYKPDWWLVMQWNPSKPFFRMTGSTDELLRRLGTDTLNESARQSMMKEIIATKTRGGWWARELFTSASRKPTDEALLRSLVRSNCYVDFITEDEVPIGRSIPNVVSGIHRNVWMVGELRVDDAQIVRDEINGVEIPPTCRLVPSDQYLQRDAELLDLDALWKQFAPDPNADGVSLKWKRDFKVSVTFQNGNQELSDSFTITVTKDLMATDASKFASTKTTAPWHARLRRAGTSAWLEIKSDDGLLEGQRTSVTATLRNADNSFQVRSGNFGHQITQYRSLRAVYFFYSEKWSQAGELSADLNFSPPILVTNPQTGEQLKIPTITVPVADPGRKLPDPE